MDSQNEYQPRHAAPETNDKKIVHLDLCNPDVIFTPEERAELDRDLGQIVLHRGQAAAKARYTYLD